MTKETLSEMRNLIIPIMDMRGYDTDLVQEVLEIIKEQDKQFIKEIKEELIKVTSINRLEDMNEIIDKKAGDKLSK